MEVAFHELAQALVDRHGEPILVGRVLEAFEEVAQGTFLFGAAAGVREELCEGTQHPVEYLQVVLVLGAVQAHLHFGERRRDRLGPPRHVELHEGEQHEPVALPLGAHLGRLLDLVRA